MTTKLVVPHMPEFPNPKTLGQRKPDSMLMAELEVWVEKIIAHAELGWQTAYREAALADELAEALRDLAQDTSPTGEMADAAVHETVLAILAKHTAARQMHKEARK